MTAERLTEDHRAVLIATGQKGIERGLWVFMVIAAALRGYDPDLTEGDMPQARKLLSIVADTRRLCATSLRK